MAESKSEVAVTKEVARAKLLGCVNKVFSECTSGDYEFLPEKVVVLKADMSLEAAYLVLLESHISSAPVWSEEKKEYVGVLDTMDMVHSVSKAYKSAGYEGSDLPSFFTEMRSLIAATRRPTSTKVSEVTEVSMTAPMVGVDVKEPLLNAVRFLTKSMMLPIHRVFVTDPETHMVKSVISQSAVIKSLAKAHKSNPELAKLLDSFSLADTGLGKVKDDTVISVHDAEPAIKAFDLMAHSGISGIPVVNGGGAMTAHISKTDLIVATKRHGTSGLNRMSAIEFVKTALRLAEKEKGWNGDTRALSITVRPSASIGHIIQKLAATSVHRLYVVDDFKRPVGVVSLKDLLKLLVL